MNVTLQQMEKMLRGQYIFKQVSFSMLLTRLKTEYAAAPTQANLEHCANEINSYLKKYRIIMSSDFAVIQKI